MPSHSMPSASTLLRRAGSRECAPSAISGSQVQTRHLHLTRIATLRSRGPFQAWFHAGARARRLQLPAHHPTHDENEDDLALAVVSLAIPLAASNVVIRRSSAPAAATAAAVAAPQTARRCRSRAPARGRRRDAGVQARLSRSGVTSSPFPMDRSRSAAPLTDGSSRRFRREETGRGGPSGPIPRSPAPSTVGHLRAKSSERREQVALLMEHAAGPVLHNSTRGDALLMNAPRYGRFLAEWGAIYERFGVPADIGLAQVIFESGLSGTRRSNANAVGFCQWQRKNWKRLSYFSPTPIQERNQTTQAPYCAAYLSVLATKYGSFIPALSEHNAGGTNVGTSADHRRASGWSGRARSIPSGLAVRPRPANAAGQGLQTGVRQLWLPLVSLR